MYFNRENVIDISKLITKKYNFFAHLSEDKNCKETLEEHTKLVEKYFFIQHSADVLTASGSCF